jgi:hypothetical protein
MDLGGGGGALISQKKGVGGTRLLTHLANAFGAKG